MVKRILVIHTFGIGDMIMFTPALECLKNKYPDSKIDFLVFQKTAGVPIENCPSVNEIFYSDFSVFGLFKSIMFIRKIRYDLSIVTSGTNPLKASIFSFLCRAKEKVGEYKKIKIPFYSRNIKYIEFAHRIENNLALVLTDSKLACKPLYCFSNKIYFEEKDNKKRKLLIHAGSNAKFSSKRWGKENFIELIKFIKQDYDFQISLISGPDEIEESRFISKNAEVELISNLSLDSVAHLISDCDVFINTDSGLGHIASCFNCKIFTIFGPAKDYKTKPYSDNACVIKLGMNCQPCYGKKVKCPHFDCLNKLSPEYAFETIKSELDKL